MKQILTPEAFKAFNHSSIFNKAVFCLGEIQGMLVNDKCSSWYNRVGDFVMSAWNRRKEILYGKWIGRRGQSKQPHYRVQSQWH